MDLNNIDTGTEIERYRERGTDRWTGVDIEVQRQRCRDMKNERYRDLERLGHREKDREIYDTNGEIERQAVKETDRWTESYRY